MTVPIALYGALASHRRGRVLREAVAATSVDRLPEYGGVLVMFADGFQTAAPEEQSRLIEWTRPPGHLLLLVPPFAAAPAVQPVTWRAERLDAPPRRGEGIGNVLASEVTYRLIGQLQTPALPGATWSDLSVCLGTYRLHPAAGLFAVTCLPLWSLAVLDAPEEMAVWMANLLDLAGQARVVPDPQPVRLQPDHYGMLVFLLSKAFQTEEHALADLRSSTIFRFSPERGRSLLNELREQGLVLGTTPTAEGLHLIMESPYAPYVSAIREVSA